MIHITSHILLPFFIILIHAFDVKYFFHAGQMIFYTKHAATTPCHDIFQGTPSFSDLSK